MSTENPDLGDDVDEIEELPDDEIASEALQSVLEEMSSVYAEDNERIPVKLAGRSAAHPDGECVFVNPDLHSEMDPPVAGPNILRLTDDLLAHEVAHVNWSDLKSKQKFAECYPGWGKVPGFVANVLEDEYVDAKRKRQWYGMRSKLAYYVWLHMNTEERAPPIDEVYEKEGRTQALMTGLFQTALAGYVKGDTEEIPDDIMEFCAAVDPLVRRVRHEDDPDERFKLFHAVMQLLIRYAPDPDEFDPDEVGDRTRESHDGDGSGDGGEPPEAPDAEEPSVELEPEDKAGLEELLEELMDEGDFPEPAPDEDAVEAEESGDDEESEVGEDEEESAGEESAGSGTSGGDEEGAEEEAESEEVGDGDGEETDGDGESDGGESAEDGDGSTTDPSGDRGVSRDVKETLKKYGSDALKVVN